MALQKETPAEVMCRKMSIAPTGDRIRRAVQAGAGCGRITDKQLTADRTHMLERHRKLLELAAKAAGIDVKYSNHLQCFLIKEPNSPDGRVWNPFANEADSDQLAEALRMDVFIDETSDTIVSIIVKINGACRADVFGSKRAKEREIREAIVLAAADIAYHDAYAYCPPKID